MKRIGMIGGVGWQSTIDYYRIINEVVAEVKGGHHSAPLLLSSVDFDPLVALAVAGNWDEIARQLIVEAKRLEAGGADLLVIGSNSLHKVARTVEDAVDISLLHIVEATAAAITKQKLKRIALLGTAFTMEDGFYQESMQSHGIEIMIPEEEERQFVHKVIFEELVHGRIVERSRDSFMHIIEGLVGRGAEGLILGCTEIPLLIQQQHVSIPLFDTTRIHAKATARWAMKE